MNRSIRDIVHHAEVSEKAIEAYLVRRAKEQGLLCLKYSSANTTGYPDRLLLLPDGRVVWIEIKTKGKHPNKLQLLRHDELRRHGHTVFVADSKEGIEKILTLNK